MDSESRCIQFLITKKTNVMMTNSINQAKEQMPSGTNPVTFNNATMPSGVGYIILDRNLNRDTYIRNCYRNNTITIITDKGEIIEKCFVDLNVWDHVKFPYSFKDRGSCVVWINIPVLNRRIVIGVINKIDEYLDKKENQSGHTRSSQINSTTIKQDAEEGSIKIMSDSLSVGGGVFVVVNNKDLAGEYHVYVQGDINQIAEKNINLTSRLGVTLYSGEDVESNAYSLLKIENGVGILAKSEFNNLFEMTEEGIELFDQWKGNISMSKDEIKIERNNNKIKFFDEVGIDISVEEDRIIRLFNEAFKDNIDQAVLSTPLIDNMTQIIDKMSMICSQISTLQITFPAGIVNPANIANIQMVNSQIQSIKGNLQKMKSKTLKIT